jgi:DNA polymerase-3 subunit chi
MPTASAPRVDFYLTDEAGDAARLRLACRIAEKAYLARQKVVCFCDDPAMLPRLDEMLWTFGDGSFVPHEIVADGRPCESPVALTAGSLPTGSFADLDGCVLINLAQGIPPFFEKFARIAEFLDARPDVRSAGRERFKAYRGQAIEPQTHNVG